MSYVVNTEYLLRATIKDVNGTLINPATVQVFVLGPGDSVAEVPMTNDSLGVYSGLWEPTLRGNWWMTLKIVNPDIHLPDMKLLVEGSFAP